MLDRIPIMDVKKCPKCRKRKPVSDTLIITKWYGRLGNNITQIVHAVSAATQYNFNTIFIPKHPYFNTTKIILENKNNTKNPCQHLLRGVFFGREGIVKLLNSASLSVDDTTLNINDTGSYIDKSVSEAVKRILTKIFILFPCQPTSPTPKRSNNDNLILSNNELVIHIRSGDVYSDNPNSGWVQPPLSFYKKVIDSYNWRQIYIICEDTKSPILNHLVKLYPNIIFKQQSLEEDIQYVINCQNICFGYGSFVPALLLLNDNIDTIFYPEYCYRGILDLCAYKKSVKYQLNNYINVGEWKNTKEQKDCMLQYEGVI